MHIILSEENANQLREKYIVLELDTIKFNANDDPVPAYCVIEYDAVDVSDLSKLKELTSLHENLIKNYKGKNWNFCEQAIEHLYNRFGGTLNSFYDEISERLGKYKEEDPGEDWDYSIHKY